MVIYLSSELMIKTILGIDNKTIDIRKCNQRELNVSLILIIDEICLDRARVSWVI